MGIVKALKESFKGTLSDQWKEIIVPGNFDEHTIVTAGLLKSKVTGKGANQNATDGVITNGSKIFVPENTAAFIINQGAIEMVITTAGSYEYKNGEKSIFNGDGTKAIKDQTIDRFAFGGISSSDTKIAYINLREIRDIKFGTRGPIIYNDRYYGCDLEIHTYGSFTIKIKNAEDCVRKFLPPNTTYYSMDDENVRRQLQSEFIQSFNVAITNLSKEFRISDLPAQSNKVVEKIKNDAVNVGTWMSRFGFEIEQVAIENIEFSKKSKELVDKYNSKKMEFKPYEDLSQDTSNIILQHQIADGIKDKKVGGVGAILALGLFKGKTKKSNESIKSKSKDLKRLKELLDTGLIDKEEYNIKKKEILGLNK